MDWKVNDAATPLLRPERSSRAVSENRGGHLSLKIAQPFMAG
jgi:hypothetical protein